MYYFWKKYCEKIITKLKLSADIKGFLEGYKKYKLDNDEKVYKSHAKLFLDNPMIILCFMRYSVGILTLQKSTLFVRLFIRALLCLLKNFASSKKSV